MSQVSKRFFSSILALIFISAAFFVYFSLIFPLYGETQKIRGEIAGKTVFLENQRQVLRQIQNLIQTYQGERELRETVALILPSQPDLAGAVAQLQGLAAANNLKFSSLTSSPGATPGFLPQGNNLISGELIKPVQILELKLKLMGRYNDWKVFLQNLETTIRLFDVKELAISPVGAPKENNYNFDLTVDAYYQNP